MSPAHAARRAGTRRRRVVIAVVLGLGVLLVASVVWIGVRGMMARTELEAAVPLANRIQQDILDDTGEAGVTFDELEDHAAAAASLTGDPIWRAGELVPFVGPNLAVVRELAESVAEVTDETIRPLVALAGELDLGAFKPVDGTVQLQPLLDAQPSVHAASSSLKNVVDRLDGLDTTVTVGFVAEAAGRLRSVVGDASDLMDAMDRTLTLMPAMLGVDGPRNYLLLFQNPAELRAGGGIAGALALVHVDAGRIELVQQASSGDFPYYPEPVIELPVETIGIYGEVAGEYIQNVTSPPQFELSAALAREMWKREFGVEVDGVFSADPVMLGYLLEATGPVELGAGEQLTADNAVDVLLRDVYARFPNPRDQDDFFAVAASAVFSRIAGGDLDPATMVGALTRAGEEGRVLLWSARETEQAVIAETSLAGHLPVSDNQVQRFGVYLHDTTASKMDYHLMTEVAVGSVSCRNDGRANVSAEVTLTNTAPADAATSLPPYVTGGGRWVQAGNIRTTVVVYGPTGALNLGAESNGEPFAAQPSTDSGYSVARYEVELAPGESSTVRINMLTGSAFSGRVETVITPGVNPPVTKDLSLIC